MVGARRLSGITVALQVKVKSSPAKDDKLELTIETTGAGGTVTGTVVLPAPMSLWLTKLDPAVRVAPAWQVNVALSSVLRGDKVRVLVNNGLEPERGEMEIRSSLVFINSVESLIQVTYRVTNSSTAESIEILQLNTTGVVVPANRVPGREGIVTDRVETGGKFRGIKQSIFLIKFKSLN